MTELTKDKICKFIDKSINNKQYNDELCFTLPLKTVQRVKEILHLNLDNYIGVISSHSIRHINKGHKSDLFYVCEIIEIIQKFSKVKKNITRDHKTGASLINLEFEKIYNKETVKLVKVKIHREYRLELKTLFKKD